MGAKMDYLKTSMISLFALAASIFTGCAAKNTQSSCVSPEISDLIAEAEEGDRRLSIVGKLDAPSIIETSPFVLLYDNPDYSGIFINVG